MPNREPDTAVRQEVLDDIAVRLQRLHPGRQFPRRGLVTLVITPRRPPPEVQHVGELPQDPASKTKE